jgi:hypothetical protein
VLIGVGRWGSLDPWLGIPVRWEQIAGARCIVESSFKDFQVKPSQGSHFFQNLTSFMVGYMTVGSANEHDFINWLWLYDQCTAKKQSLVHHLQLEAPILIKMNGQNKHGVIIKPEE